MTTMPVLREKKITDAIAIDRHQIDDFADISPSLGIICSLVFVFVFV
jgi:hypothetical protein